MQNKFFNIFKNKNFFFCSDFSEMMVFEEDIEELMIDGMYFFFFFFFFFEIF